jgi:GNAT superfamily N-acetyltransferase
VLDGFDSGEPALDDWLKRFALEAEAARTARVFVTTEDGLTVVGYYALAAGQVERSDASERAAKRQPDRPVPAVLLARLAVDRLHQKAGLGTSLLQDAMQRTEQVAEEAGIRVLLVHAKHDQARNWYLRFGFEESPTDRLHLMLLVKDLAVHLRRIGL